MRRILILAPLLLALVSSLSWARPVTDYSITGYGIVSTAAVNPLPASDVQTGPVNVATYYFGGTTWAADSLRWEALPDSIWTFESGVGSHFQHTDACKDTLFHALMEGWSGVDLSHRSEGVLRRLSVSDFASSPSVCVGAPAGLGGEYSFWAGILQDEADSLCWAEGQGYGNNWYVCLVKTIEYDGAGCLQLEYSFHNDTEYGWDYTYVLVDTTCTGY